jgi:threonine dehydrogenase-like Zn-dependent dehydrogenase
MVRVAVLDAPESLRVANVGRPSVGPSDLRVRVLGCGVCGSDVTSYFTGAYVSAGQVMGHEFVGRVVAAGAELPGDAVGSVVAVRPMRSCKECWYCDRGDIHLCAGTATRSLSFGLPGGYAEEVHVPDARWGVDVIPLGDVDAADGIWVEPLAVAQHAVACAGLSAGGRVLVVGAGSIGISLAAMAARAGAEVAVVEPRAVRRAAVHALGLGAAFASGTQLAGRPVDAVIDSSGSSDALASVAACVGSAVPFTLVGVTSAVLPDLGHRAVSGAFGYTAQDFCIAAGAVGSGAVRLQAAVTHRFPLDDLAAAMHAVRHDPDAVKVMITP